MHLFSVKIFFSWSVLSILILPLKNNCQNVKEIPSIKTVIKNEIAKHPEMEIQDIYKLLHQSALGSEHAVEDTAAVRKWMENEIAGLNWNPKEEMIDTISPGGKIVRVNLRRYLKAGRNPEKLLNAFVKIANEYKGNKSVLEKYLDMVLEMIDKEEINFLKSESKKFFNDLKEKGYPAVHHSQKYTEKYSPAYRVVAGELIESLKND